MHTCKTNYGQTVPDDLNHGIISLAATINFSVSACAKEVKRSLLGKLVCLFGSIRGTVLISRALGKIM